MGNYKFLTQILELHNHKLIVVVLTAEIKTISEFSNSGGNDSGQYISKLHSIRREKEESDNLTIGNTRDVQTMLNTNTVKVNE